MADAPDLALDDVNIPELKAYPADTSVKLHGPPGTGKTTVAAARVAKLIAEYGYSINDVVWITYRKSLAMETLRRLSAWGVVEDRALSDPGSGSTRYIATAHAVANRVVGGAGEPVGYGDKRRFCENRNLQFKKSTPWDQPPGRLLFDVFDYAAKNRLDPTVTADLRTIPATQDLREKYRGSIPRAYRDWNAYKQKENKIDFWEMLAAPLDEGVTPGKPILVVDEYHDAYPLMAELVEAWANTAEIVIVAGDPHQVVNTFDGADPEFYRRMDYPEILLPRTYRVPREHWGPATGLLANAHEPPGVDLDSAGYFEVTLSPTFDHSQADGWTVPSPVDEHSPAWIVDKYGEDTMLLTRTTHQLDGVARALEKAGILFEVPSSSDVTGWGRGYTGMNARTAVYNALQKLTRFEPATFDDPQSGQSRFGSGDGPDPAKTILEPEEAAHLLDRSKAKYLTEPRSKITDTAESWLVAEEPVSAADLSLLVTLEFWGTYTHGSRSTHYLNKSGRLSRHFDQRDFEALTKTLQRYRSPVGASVATKVYTIHASKGNEADTVAVYDGITKRIRKAMDRDPSERRNEWRTWYVALTRAKTNLIVLKDGFAFTERFLPRGRALLADARATAEAKA